MIVDRDRKAELKRVFENEGETVWEIGAITRHDGSGEESPYPLGSSRETWGADIGSRQQSPGVDRRDKGSSSSRKSPSLSPTSPALWIGTGGESGYSDADDRPQGPRWTRIVRGRSTRRCRGEYRSPLPRGIHARSDQRFHRFLAGSDHQYPSQLVAEFQGTPCSRTQAIEAGVRFSWLYAVHYVRPAMDPGRSSSKTVCRVRRRSMPSPPACWNGNTRSIPSP